MSMFDIPPRRRAFVRLIGAIQNELNAALATEHARNSLNKAELAAILGTSKSFITRKLTGTGNMTLETLTDLAWAMGYDVKISLKSRGDPAS